MMQEIIKEQTKRVNEILEKSLRENAVPKISGEITKRKLRWRGIRLVERQTFQGSVRWIEQRGKRISPKIVFEAKYHI